MEGPSEKTASEKLTYLSKKLSDRLAAVHGNAKDLLSYFMDPEGFVPVSALLMDKSRSFEAFRNGPSREAWAPETWRNHEKSMEMKGQWMESG